MKARLSLAHLHRAVNAIEAFVEAGVEVDMVIAQFLARTNELFGHACVARPFDHHVAVVAVGFSVGTVPLIVFMPAEVMKKGFIAPGLVADLLRPVIVI